MTTKDAEMAVIFFIAFCFIAAEAANKSDEHVLHENLFANYNKNIRPGGDEGTPVNVEIHISLHQIAYLKSEEQNLKTVLVMTVEWEDTNLKWTPSLNGNVSHMVLPASELWLPDFGIENSAGKFYDPSSTNYRLQLHYTGEVTWSFGGHITTRCEIDVFKFPFDQQVCDFSLINWMYDEQAVNLTLKEFHMDTDEYHRSVEWDLLDTKCSRKSVVHEDRDGRTYPSVTCAMLLSRRPTFYVINLFVPSYLILMLFLVSFLLPPTHRATVPLQMTTLLIFSVMLLNISAKLPHTDQLAHISSFALAIMGLATISVTMSAVVSLIRMNMDTSLRVPKTLRTIYFDYLAVAFCLSTTAKDVKGKTVPDDQVEHLQLNDLANEESSSKFTLESEQTKILALLLANSIQMRQHLKMIENNTKVSPVKVRNNAEWDLMSKVTSRLCFCLFLIAVLSLSIEFALVETSRSRTSL